MTRKSQKEEERWFLDKFLEAVQFEGVDRIDEGDPVPDFVIRTSEGKKIGVEVTQLFRSPGEVGRPRQAVESARLQLLKATGEVWKGRGHPNVEVHVFFQSGADYLKTELPEVAHVLVELVRQHLPDRNAVNRVEWSWERRAEWPKGVEGCSIVRLDSYTRSYWSGVDADYVPLLSRELLGSVIERKNKPDYVIGDETWLFMVVDAARLSSSFDLQGSELAVDATTVFDRLYVFEAVQGLVHEVKVQGRTAANGA